MGDPHNHDTISTFVRKASNHVVAGVLLVASEDLVEAAVLSCSVIFVADGALFSAAIASSVFF